MGWKGSAGDQYPTYSLVSNLVNVVLGLCAACALAMVVGLFWHLVVTFVLVALVCAPVNPVSRALDRSIRGGIGAIIRAVDRRMQKGSRGVLMLLGSFVLSSIALRVLVPPLEVEWSAKYPDALEDMKEILRNDEDSYHSVELDFVYLSDTSCIRFVSLHPEAVREADDLLTWSSWWRLRMWGGAGPHIEAAAACRYP